MAYGIPFTAAVLFVFSCSLIYAVSSASSSEFNKDMESSRERRAATESEEPIFYCTEVDFPEDIICDMSNITSGRDEWKDLVPEQDGQLVFFKGYMSIHYAFTGGEILKRFEYQYVRLAPADYEPPTRDVKMDEYSYVLMNTVKFKCFMQIELVDKICGKMGENGKEKHSSLMKYKFISPEGSICYKLVAGRIVKDFFEVPRIHNNTRCPPRKN